MRKDVLIGGIIAGVVATVTTGLIVCNKRKNKCSHGCDCCETCCCCEDSSVDFCGKCCCCCGCCTGCSNYPDCQLR